MANYFIIAGPKNDPAGVRSATEAAQAFEMIATSKTPFASRGDDSGTHIKEKVIWTEALGKIPQGESWYLESGKGMGETLVIADEKRGYTITDLGSFLKFADKIDLTAVFNRSSPLLYNPYGIMAVNPARHPHIKYLEAMNDIWGGTEAYRRIQGPARQPDVHAAGGTREPVMGREGEGAHGRRSADSETRGRGY
jgi:tungstate transport system substrate-binding protein